MTDQKENNKFTAYAIGVCDSIDELRQLATVEEDFVFPLCYCIGKSTLENRSASVEALTGKSSNEKIEEGSQEKEVVHNTVQIDEIAHRIIYRANDRLKGQDNYFRFSDGVGFIDDVREILKSHMSQSTKGNTLKP